MDSAFGSTLVAKKVSDTIAQPFRDVEGEYNLEHLEAEELEDYILKKSLFFVETSDNSQSLLHWAEEIQRAKLKRFLMNPKFVKRTIEKVKRVRGCVQTLLETIKGILNVDYSKKRQLGTVSALQVVLPSVLTVNPDELYCDELGNVDQVDDPRYVLPELSVFLLRQLTVMGIGTGEQMPSYVQENMVDVMSQLWKNMREETMACEEIPAVMDSSHSLLMTWSRTRSTQLSDCKYVMQGLTCIQGLVRRVLELYPNVIGYPKYGEIRYELQRLQKRLQLYNGHYKQLQAKHMHSSLPTPPPKPGLMLDTTTGYLRSQLMLQRAPDKEQKLRRKADLDKQLSNTAACSIGQLDGWIRTTCGRVRPWSASTDRPSSPIVSSEPATRPEAVPLRNAMGASKDWASAITSAHLNSGPPAAASGNSTRNRAASAAPRSRSSVVATPAARRPSSAAASVAKPTAMRSSSTIRLLTEDTEASAAEVDHVDTDRPTSPWARLSAKRKFIVKTPVSTSSSPGSSSTVQSPTTALSPSMRSPLRKMSVHHRRSSIKSPTRGQLGERLLGKAEEVEEMSSDEPRRPAMWAVLPERWAQLLDNKTLKQAQEERMKEEKEQEAEAEVIREQMHRMPRTSKLLQNFYRDSLKSAAVEEKDVMDDLTEESFRQDQEDRVTTQKQRVSSMNSDLEYMQRVLNQACGDVIVDTEPEDVEEPEEEVMQYVQAKSRGAFSVN